MTRSHCMEMASERSHESPLTAFRSYLGARLSYPAEERRAARRIEAHADDAAVFLSDVRMLSDCARSGDPEAYERTCVTQAQPSQDCRRTARAIAACRRAACRREARLWLPARSRSRPLHRPLGPAHPPQEGGLSRQPIARRTTFPRRIAPSAVACVPSTHAQRSFALRLAASPHHRLTLHAEPSRRPILKCDCPRCCRPERESPLGSGRQPPEIRVSARRTVRAMVFIGTFPEIPDYSGPVAHWNR